MNKIIAWAKENKIRLNEGKSKVMLMTEMGRACGAYGGGEGGV